MDLSPQFMSLFRGLERAHGTFSIDGSSKKDGTKKGGKALTVRRDMHKGLWEDHLTGKQGLGVIPIRDDSHCFFGAVDIDVYPVNLAEVARKIHDLNLPILPCRSKSGGIHGYVFFSDPVPATLLVPKLKDFASALGFGGCETFPKQTQVISERGDVGNWINMPYFDCEKTERYGIKADGSQMSAVEFLSRAEDLKISASDLKKITVRSTDMADGPPCMQYLITQGFPSGTRNESLSALCLYLKKSNPNGWREEAFKYNDLYMRPPLSSEEVASVVTSIGKKDYLYPCSKDLLKPHCNPSVCRTRKHGVLNTTASPIMSALTKYDSHPPVWFVEIEGGGRMELTTEALQNQIAFQRRCMEVLHVVPQPLAGKVWLLTLNKLLEKVNIIAAPDESTPQGQLIELLEQFCTSKAQGRTREDIAVGKPWLNDGLHHFRLKSFKAFLKRQDFKELPDHKISATLQERGARHSALNIDGHFVRIWTFPQFLISDQMLSVPQFEQPKDPF